MLSLNRVPFALVLLFAGSPAVAGVRYVDVSAAGANNGTSWSDAFTTFDAALNAAQPGDEVWVADGTYPVPSDAGFIAPVGVSLYGGFAGNETSISQRNIAVNVSRLTGFHPIRGVVVLTLNNAVAGTVVDGFKLDGTLTSQPHAGGGMIIQGGSPTIRNCWFFDNIAGNAAGAFVSNSDVTFEDCFFDRNWSQVGDGGGIRAVGTGSLTVRRCRFIGNFCRELYGVQGRGGGIYNDAGSVLRVSDCFFDDNWAYNLGQQLVTQGGGIANNSPDARIESCVFLRNEASLGGGVYSGAPITIVNCLFSGNLASEPANTTPFQTGEGGGIFGEPNVPVTVKSCTIAANWSKHTAAGVSMDGSFENCIVWYNVSLVEPGDNPETLIDQQYKGNVDIRYSDVAGLLGGGGPDPLFPGSIESDPIFVVAPTLTNNGSFVAGDLHLRSGSPCLDAGDNAAVPAGTTTDLEGSPRFFDDPAAPNVGLGTPPHVDMGAYERVSDPCTPPGSPACAQIQPFCFGTSAACPCGNAGAATNGCANSGFAGGANLAASGTPSVAGDTVTLTASDMTGSIAVFFQGATQTPPTIIDDGVGCVGGPIVRLGNRPAAGSSFYPQPGDPIISVRGAIPPAGGTFYYQCFYRNAAAAFCPPATSNRTNGVRITWAP